MRNYLLYTRTPEGQHIEDINKCGDEDTILSQLAVRVLRGVADLLDDGTISDYEAFDLIDQLKRIDREALYKMDGPVDTERLALINVVYWIRLAS